MINNEQHSKPLEGYASCNQGEHHAGHSVRTNKTLLRAKTNDARANKTRLPRSLVVWWQRVALHSFDQQSLSLAPRRIREKGIESCSPLPSTNRQALNSNHNTNNDKHNHDNNSNNTHNDANINISTKNNKRPRQTNNPETVPLQLREERARLAREGEYYGYRARTKVVLAKVVS